MGFTDIWKTDIPTLTDFITTQSTYLECHPDFPSVGKLDSRFSLDSDGVLVGVFPSEEAFQRVVRATLFPHFLYVRHYFLLTRNPV